MTGNAALIASRGVYYIATMLLFGSAAFGAILRARLPVIPPARLPRWWLLVLALVAAMFWLALAAAQMADTTLDGAIIAQAVHGTLFGQIFAARLALLALLAGCFAFSRGDRWIALVSGLALALPAITSHAAASSPAGFTAIGATLDAAHLLTGGFWIGGLAVLAALFRRKEINIALALSLFSEWAMVGVLVLVMTGLINAASILLGAAGKPSALYLGVLGLKLMLVSAMLALAVINRFRLMPRADTVSIARNAALELALGFTVVLLAGALGQLQPAL